MTDVPPVLALTGERTLPGIWHETYWFRRHQAGYRWLVDQGVKGTVVDAGVGEGYGAAMLRAAGADPVLAIDLDPVVLRHALTAYGGMAVLAANLVRLPVRDAGVDVVVSAQTVEHLWDQPGFVAECARVLRPGGRLLLTTPNRRTFPRGNPFHSRELDAAELRDLVDGHLAVTVVAGLHHGPRLRDLDAATGGLVDRQLADPPQAWSDDLAAAVRSVTADDFEVGAPEGSLDLLLAAQA